MNEQTIEFSKNFAKYNTFSNDPRLLPSLFYLRIPKQKGWQKEFNWKIGKKSERILLVGIASDERIWKLCWEINRLLEIDMKAIEKEILESKTEPFQEWATEQRLFSFSMEEDNIFYQDDKSRKDQDFLLFSARFTERSKNLRAFRYLFVIRYEGELFTGKEELIHIVNSSSIVLSAVDLTDYNDLNPQLP